MASKNKIELICERRNDDTQICRAGYIIDEDKNFLKIASTVGNQGHKDKVLILKKNIVKRLILEIVKS